MTTPVDLARRHAVLLDRHLRGVTVGVYLVGSVALGDYRDGVSDVDTVTVVGRELAADDGDALRAVHASLPGRPSYDTTYVPQAWLGTAPEVCAMTPFSLDGELRLDEPAPQLGPPTWRELLGATTVVGPEPSQLGVRDDPEALRQWLIGNLTGYWASTAADARMTVADRPATQPANAEGVAWMALGAARLHATLVTGRIISKSQAGKHVARFWPGYTDLAARCVQWRHGHGLEFTTVDALAAADLMDTVVATAPPA